MRAYLMMVKKALEKSINKTAADLFLLFTFQLFNKALESDELWTFYKNMSV